jgi:hypothetical protein
MQKQGFLHAQKSIPFAKPYLFNPIRSTTQWQPQAQQYQHYPNSR